MIRSCMNVHQAEPADIPTGAAHPEAVREAIPTAADPMEAAATRMPSRIRGFRRRSIISTAGVSGKRSTHWTRYQSVPPCGII